MPQLSKSTAAKLAERRLLKKNHDARVERLYDLAEKLGRVSGQAHKLASDLTAKIIAHRAGTRSTNPAKAPHPPRTENG